MALLLQLMGVDVTVKLDDATKDKIDNAANKDLSNLTPAGEQKVKDLAAWNVVANNGTAEKVQGGDTVKFIDGDNVSITQNGKEFTVTTKKDVTFDNVTANQKITAPESEWFNKYYLESRCNTTCIWSCSN